MRICRECEEPLEMSECIILTDGINEWYYHIGKCENKGKRMGLKEIEEII